ncbi:hypothetical protein BDF20DRAFT_842379 [Mycotypha africana]|uniref:uncharacterized protein n=1 Tax=Mycotypha africana TaxID=64632 RepID=UPI002300C423|nr:uncharacterized protein BDF20DRAFT_842379 [Mycotypha africana]KAI8991048.1 hypothetical protein BDF20DRAFT_842379 [Mycotypha africana]
MYYNHPSFSPTMDATMAAVPSTAVTNTATTAATAAAVEDDMNLLISPFEPFSVNDMNQINYNNTMPMQQPNTNTLHESSMSPMPTKFNLYESSPPMQPHFEMMSHFTTNDFISRSPESSSSSMNDSNMISPPTQFYSTANYMHPTITAANDDYPDYIWPDAFDHYSTLKRSSSVPPGFHKNKPDPQDPVYSFQQQQQQPSYPMVPSQPPLPQQQQQQPQPQSQQQPKVPLPIQIKRLIRSHQANNVNHKAPLDPEQHRRQLDKKLEKVNFDDITVAELKEMLRERGLSATGRKAELMHRLKEEHGRMIHRKHGIVSAPPPPPPPLPAMNGIAAVPGGADTVAAGSASVPMTHRRVSAALTHNKPHHHHSKNVYNYYYNYHSPYATPPIRHNSISTAHLNLQHQYEMMAGDTLASSAPHPTPAFYTHYPPYHAMAAAAVPSPSAVTNTNTSAMKPSQLRASFAAPTQEQDSHRMEEESTPLSSMPLPLPPEAQLQPHPLPLQHHPFSHDPSDLWDDHQLQNFLNQI